VQWRLEILLHPHAPTVVAMKASPSTTTIKNRTNFGWSVRIVANCSNVAPNARCIPRATRRRRWRSPCNTKL